MSELLKKVAKLLGVPENLIQRSAEARADASGKSPEEVLQSWSGGEAVESVEEESLEEEKEEEVIDAEVEEEGGFFSFIIDIGMFLIPVLTVIGIILLTRLFAFSF